MYKQSDWRRMPGPGDEETWGPCTGHPMDPRTPEPIEESGWYQDKAKEEFLSRLDDIGGWFLESITEAPDDKLKELAKSVKTAVDPTKQEESTAHAAIGLLVVAMVEKYCWPGDEWEPEPDEPDEPDYDEDRRRY